MEAWRNRPLGSFRYVWFDARYKKVRVDGIVRDAAVLLAVRLNADGKREVIGVSVSLSEAEFHWRTFRQSLVKRGLLQVELIVRDAHQGLQAARQAVFGGLLWQRCQFHLQQNAHAYLPRADLKTEAAADIRPIFDAPDRPAAEALLPKTVAKYSRTASRLDTWLEHNLPQGLTVFSLPPAHRRRLRTTNGLERLNREIRRRSRVAALFPNEASCLRLVTAIVMETSEEWLTDRTYMFNC